MADSVLEDDVGVAEADLWHLFVVLLCLLSWLALVLLLARRRRACLPALSIWEV